MPDDRWSRGKCSMKALLYMAASSAVVCSAVGHNLEVIQSEENGLLATTEREWVEALSRLVQDEGLRNRLGVAGRVTVQNRFSREICGEALARVVHGLVRT